MVNTSTNPSLLKWYFPLLWTVVNIIVSPIAIFAGLMATYIAAPWNSGPIEPQGLSDPVFSLIIRSLAFAIIAGLILEVPRWFMLQPILKSALWIPITVIALAVAMFVISHNQEARVVENLIWPNCFANSSDYFASFMPVLLPGILQSLFFAKNHYRWYLWLVAGSMSYILPLFGFMACSNSGLFAGTLLASLFTGLALQNIQKESSPVATAA